MLKSLVLGFGPTPDHSPLTVPIGSAVVFVGPNNSGKSRLLQELEYFLKGNAPPGYSFLLLKDVECELPRNESLLKKLLGKVREDLPKVVFRPPVLPPGNEAGFKEVDADDLSRTTKMIEEGKLILTSEPNKVAEILNDKISTYLTARVYLNNLKDADEDGDCAKEPEITEAERFVRSLARAGARMIRDMRCVAHEAGIDQAILAVLKDGRVRTRPYVYLLGPETLRLDGQQRLMHVRPDALPTQSSRGDNPFTRLLKDPSARQQLRKLVHEAFGQHLSIDVSSFKVTELKLAPEAPGEHELAPLKPEAMEYFRKARSIEEFSDGVKSFVGLHAAVLSSEYLVMLVDEPEAFLHPPLARRLGQNLHQLARERGAHVLAATHSADFLMGCIQSALDVNIVRLTYRHGVPTARLLPVQELKQMMLDPLLRSTGTLSALFHEGAVICEGDSDRAFYLEINERLLRKNEGVDGCIFMNAHSKQNIHRIVNMLRRIGIPAAAIIDLDILLDDNTLKDLLWAANADAATIDSLGVIKGNFRQLFFNKGEDKKTGKELLKSRGVRALDDKQQKSMINLFFKPLAQLGIFVVPPGELEGWLLHLHPEGKGPAKSGWLNAIFEALGSDPTGRYVHPADGDVWDFVRDIGTWIGNPNRQGMPDH